MLILPFYPSTGFPDIDLPAEFAYVQAIDWLLDRFRTAVNVAGDTSVCGVIAMRNEQNPALGGALEFTTDEKKSIISEGDSKFVAVIRERASNQHKI